MPPTVPEVEIFPVLKGKVAIITGAAQGMGKATTEVFLKAGAKVVMCDIKEKEGQDVAAEFSQFGDVLFVKADISKSEEVRNLVEKTVAKFGRLDAAINNAALTPDTTPLIDFDEDYWSKLTDINLKGTALCCKWEMQQMIKQGGRGTIVNIASINAFKPQPTMPAYTAAKHALIGLTKHAAMEGGPHNIRVNAIAPGAIYTDMSAAAIKAMEISEEEFSQKFSFLNRFALPREVAQGSLWLSSDASSYVTGIAMPIDGGCLANPRVHEGKLALVTGSARSIGAAIVRNLASKGCNIIVNHATETSDKAAADLCSELHTAHGVKAIWIRANVSNKEDCNKIVEAAKTHFTSPQTGKMQLDILIHNAAIGYIGSLEDVTEADFYKMYSVNVLGPILLTQVFVPYLPTDRSGRIVMMSSINSKIGPVATTIYSGTKGALEATARVMSRELAERVTVNTINPGPVMTDMYLTAPEEIKQTLALWNPVTPLAPVRPTDTPDVQELGKKLGGRAAYDYEIAGIVSMLCSPESGWCTGSLISANGGLAFSL
ncbi:NAD(P)-binding protein [Daldinia decipiens]|uniref:NAD(P)-binding protein n=1 Tax=Daldinia decipiens TaxID=326647 RepID=UPI0020C3948F|nr:NAD(P)-binding protein [Daldinia decipiens]KAI1652444.1 NAD(P)-binding protein [Daldinia decipiens]